MTDKDVEMENFDYDGFSKWAFKMLQNGRCMLRQCAEYRSYDGPTAMNQKCRDCFREQTA